MHHWTLTTHSTVSLTMTLEAKNIWQAAVPHLGNYYSFLMHSILAFTSAHKAHLDPFRKEMYLEVAQRHHVSASMLFRSSFPSGIKASLSGPLLVFSILTVVTSMGLSQQVCDEKSDLDEFINWLLLTHRSTRLARVSRLGDRVENRLSGLLKHAVLCRQSPLTLDVGLLLSLDILESANLNALSISSTDGAVISLSIIQTKQWFTLVPIQPHNLVFIIRWIDLLPDEYFELLRKKKPFALALIGH
jgi:hypothetical protein